VLENRALRRIFGPKRDQVAEELWKLHSEELHNLYSSQNIIRHIKSRRMRWTRIGEEREVYNVWWERPKERNHSEDRSIDVRMGSERLAGRV
jgi:hypothetical protein